MRSLSINEVQFVSGGSAMDLAYVNQDGAGSAIGDAIQSVTITAPRDQATDNFFSGMLGMATRGAAVAFVDGIIAGAEVGAAGGPVGVLAGVVAGAAAGYVAYKLQANEYLQ